MEAAAEARVLALATAVPIVAYGPNRAAVETRETLQTVGATVDVSGNALGGSFDLPRVVVDVNAPEELKLRFTAGTRTRAPS